jgi:hypothetical protein
VPGYPLEELLTLMALWPGTGTGVSSREIRASPRPTGESLQRGETKSKTSLRAVGLDVKNRAADAPAKVTTNDKRRTTNDEQYVKDWLCTDNQVGFSCDMNTINHINLRLSC